MSLGEDNLKQEAAYNVINNLPTKSREKYMRAYDDFQKWRSVNRVKTFSESVLLTYFNELSQKLLPSSLWAVYSMLKTTLNCKDNVNLKNYTKLLAFLKRKAAGFKAKKSKMFTSEDVEKFINTAPDEKYLVTKVALIFGITGACKTQELLNITVDDIETHENCFVIKLPNAETKIERVFVVRGDFAEFVNKYRLLRPENPISKRFFLNYQNGRCLRQNIGKNKFLNMPKQIATYLKLPNPERYTGHCFRRTSATLLADSVANLNMKRRRGWKPEQVAESNIDNSIQNKNKITCAEPTSADLNVAITGAMTDNLSKQDVDYILGAFTNRVLEESATRPGSAGPVFKGKPVHEGGALKIWCDDSAALEWLRATVASITLPHGEALVIKRHDDLQHRFLGSILLPGVWDVVNAGRALKYQNPWAQIDRWRILKAVTQDTDTQVMVSIPEDLVKLILERECRLALVVGSVHIKFHSPKGTFTETSLAGLDPLVNAVSPVEPMDEVPNNSSDSGRVSPHNIFFPESSDGCPERLGKIILKLEQEDDLQSQDSIPFLDL